MYVPIYQGLTPFDFARPVRRRATCFPFDAPRHWYFYRARNAIYHLFRALAASGTRLTVLAPDYNSGNEVLAMQAAGARIRYCAVDRGMRLDPGEVERRCERHRPDVLYVIHYAGWPQPMAALEDLCRRRNMLLIEDCALALLSAGDGRPLGSFGHWAIFCLYKTLPLANGAVLVQNADHPSVQHAIDDLPLKSAGIASSAGRSAELMVQRLRSRADRLGAVLQRVKRDVGRAASAIHVHRARIGDIGFELGDVDLAMSGVSMRVLQRLDLEAIRRRRAANFRQLADRLRDRATPVFSELPDGVCPLFFPILVPHKHLSAVKLQTRGIEALEFWNDRVDVAACELSAAERFLRAHVLELPIHQDLTPRHIDYLADQVASLELRMRDDADAVFAA